MPKALTLTDVTKRYGRDVPVIDHLNHSFEPGTLSLLVGPNGSGKTTLLRLLSTLAYPTSGTVRYGDIDIHEQPYAYLEHAGVVHAEPELPEHLSALELLEWVLRARGLWDESAPDRLNAILDRLLLDERRVNLIGTYSSGMAKKAQIAAALVTEPSVVLMDEPLRSLDAETTDATVTLINEVRARGGLVVVSSHLTDALETHADHVLSTDHWAAASAPASA